MKTTILTEKLKQIPAFHLYPIVAFNPLTEMILKMDFTIANNSLTSKIIEDVELFSNYITQQLQSKGAAYGIGGYDEHRTVYSRSKVFDSANNELPRRLHLGIDIWGSAGTEVFAPLDGEVLSFAFNQQYGDYGATIILKHQIDELHFYSLYGHLSLADIQSINKGDQIKGGDLLAHFGEPNENGQWPPHLHFQLMYDLEGNVGDYPGVCSLENRNHYLANCPDPDCILGLMQYAK